MQQALMGEGLRASAPLTQPKLLPCPGGPLPQGERAQIGPLLLLPNRRGQQGLLSL